VAEGDFSRNNRLLKLARSLTVAGHDVVRVGIQITEDLPLHEHTEFGEIIRVPTAIAGVLYGALRPWLPDCVICVNPPTAPVGARARRIL